MHEEAAVPLHTGRSMPLLGLGTWELTEDTAGTVEFALARGYRMIDTAGDYGSQEGIGEALRRTDVPRERIFLVAKVEEDEDAFEATRRYLGEMRQEYADMMLIHRPPPEGVGERLWEGLARAREEGLTREIGVSNYSTGQLDRLTEAAGEVPAVNQIEWTPFGWSREMLAYCREHAIVIQAYSPLTRGERLYDDKLRRLAKAREVTPAQIMIRWNLQRGVVPLPKANQRDHLLENLAALDLELEEGEMEALDDMNESYSALGFSLSYLSRG